MNNLISSILRSLAQGRGGAGRKGGNEEKEENEKYNFKNLIPRCQRKDISILFFSQNNFLKNSETMKTKN